MTPDWNNEAEQERFLDLWRSRRHTGMHHTAADWNARAVEWDKGLRENDARRARSERRIQATVDYLGDHGLLSRGDDVVDIGCGPGRFVTEFARTARHVTGIDISPGMVGYAADYAKSAGRDNCTFEACDFRAADIDARGWKKRFDLVFSSITPALSEPEDFAKAESMSRAFCFNSTFIRSAEPLRTAALEFALPEYRLPLIWDGRSFYAMFNLLWLRGRYPEVKYFKEYSDDAVPADRSLALRITEKLPEDAATDAVLARVEEYLKAHADKEGLIAYPMERWYGWLLWDVRDDAPRNYSEALRSS